MASIFISYSSLDEDFVAALRTDLSRDHEVWVDHERIPAGAQFRDSIRAAVEAAEVFIVVLTREWQKSEECRKELALALELKKRIVPLEPYRALREPLPPGLDGLSPIGFWRKAGRKAALGKLRNDLVADHEWLAAHRDLLVDGLRWQRSEGKDVRLRGAALRDAVRMVERANASSAAPDLLPVQRDYVSACETAEAAEVERLTALNRRVVARHLLAEAQHAWSVDPSNIGLALRLLAESMRRAPSSTARGLINELTRTLPMRLVQLQVPEDVKKLVFSAYGTSLAYASSTRLIAWRSHTWKSVLDQTLRAHVLELRFDHDALIALVGDGSVLRFGMEGQALATIVDGLHFDKATLSESGRHIAWSLGTNIYVQSLVQRDNAPLHFESPLPVSELALSPCGRYLFVCAMSLLLPVPGRNPYLARLIDTVGVTAHDLTGEFMMNPVFSPDGRFVIAKGVVGSTVWSVPDAQLKRELPGNFVAWHTNPVSALLERPFVMRTDEPRATRRELLEWNSESGEVRSLFWMNHFLSPAEAFTLRGRRMLAVSDSGAVRVFDLRRDKPAAIIPYPPDLKAQVRTVVCGSRLALASGTGIVQVFDLDAEGAGTMGPFIAAIHAVAASRDGRWLGRSLEHTEGADYGSLRVTERGAGPRAKTGGSVKRLALANDGSFAAITTVIHRLGAQGKPSRGKYALVLVRSDAVREWPRSGEGKALAISADGQFVADLGNDGIVRWLDARAADSEPIELPTSDSCDLAFDDINHFLLVRGNARVDLFDCGSMGRHLGDLEGIICSCFDRRQGLWAADADRRLRRYALPSMRTTRNLTLPFPPTMLLAGDRADPLLAVHENAVVILDPASGNELNRMEHLDVVRQIDRSPSGRYILVTTGSGRAIVWALASATQVFEIDERYPVAVWLEGDRIAIRKGNLFNIEPADHREVIEDALKRSDGPLTQQEWRAYIPDEPWRGV